MAKDSAGLFEIGEDWEEHCVEHWDINLTAYLKLIRKYQDWVDDWTEVLNEREHEMDQEVVWDISEKRELYKGIVEDLKRLVRRKE